MALNWSRGHPPSGCSTNPTETDARQRTGQHVAQDRGVGLCRGEVCMESGRMPMGHLIEGDTLGWEEKID